MRKWIAAFLSTIILIIPIMSHAFGSEADHEALRELMNECTNAMNQGKFDQLKPYLDEQFTIITVDNSKLSSLASFQDYWDKIFKGDKPLLTKLTIKPEADDKTHFITDEIGVVHGTSKEKYHFTDGDVRKMNTRWTAVVHKENDQWKLMKIHFSSNILDNPVLSALKGQMFKVAVIGACVGFVLGLFFMLFMRRKKA